MSLRFDTYAQGGNEFIHRVNESLSVNDKSRAGRITRCVLRALRRHLTIEESFQLISQLPMAIKGVYIDGWRIGEKRHRIKHVQEFLEEVMVEDGSVAWRDFSGTEDAREGVDAVFRTLAYYVSPGEIHDVIAVLPRELKILLTETIAV